MRLFFITNSKLALVIGLVLGISGAALAAFLHFDHVGTTRTGSCVWHFVNNQTEGAAAGTLTAEFDIGDCETGPRLPVNQNVQHFFCNTTGTAVLESAFTDLPGKLVLSDVICATPTPTPTPTVTPTPKPSPTPTVTPTPTPTPK
jgi:hypothetical protein